MSQEVFCDEASDLKQYVDGDDMAGVWLTGVMYMKHES